MQLQEQVITIKVKFWSEFQKDMFTDLWKAIELWALRYWEQKHKINKIDIENNLLPTTTNEA